VGYVFKKFEVLYRFKLEPLFKITQTTSAIKVTDFGYFEGNLDSFYVFKCFKDYRYGFIP